MSRFPLQSVQHTSSHAACPHYTRLVILEDAHRSRREPDACDRRYHWDRSNSRNNVGLTFRERSLNGFPFPRLGVSFSDAKPPFLLFQRYASSFSFVLPPIGERTRDTNTSFQHTSSVLVVLVLRVLKFRVHLKWCLTIGTRKVKTHVTSEMYRKGLRVNTVGGSQNQDDLLKFRGLTFHEFSQRPRQNSSCLIGRKVLGHPESQWFPHRSPSL